MEIRRPVAALFVALALVGGGTSTLTGCADPSGGPASDERNDGTTDDDSGSTEGNNPSDVSQGNLPDNSDQDQDSERNQDSGDDG
jgi:hypothetical protein